MKTTGIVRKIDEMGRLVIPKELCRNFGIRPGDPVEFFADGKKIIITKFEHSASAVVATAFAAIDGLVHLEPDAQKSKELLEVQESLQKILSNCEKKSL